MMANFNRFPFTYLKDIYIYKIGYFTLLNTAAFIRKKTLNSGRFIPPSEKSVLKQRTLLPHISLKKL